VSFAGQLDKTVSIEDYVTGASDGMGGYAAGSWVPIYKKVKAAIVIISRENQILAYDKENVFADVYWYLEYLSGVRESQRIHWGSKIYDIKLVLPWEEKARFMKLACVEVGRQI
jgi:SPP1 family predicted phage head-tail adaptor